MLVWSLGTFGIGVYIHALSVQRNFSVSLVSSAVTLSYLVTAAALMFAGTAIVHYGPRSVIGAGAVLLGISVMGIPWCVEPWHVFALMVLMGIGRSCLSTTTISTGLAPWFERHQGRAISLALLGASMGGIIGTPLLFGVSRFSALRLPS